MEVLYEDNHIIAVNKTCNEIVQGDKTGDTPLSEIVKAYIKDKYNKPGEVFLGVTHRLDRPTSGVVLFARTSKALTRLNEMFKEKSKVESRKKNCQLSIVNCQLRKPIGRLCRVLQNYLRHGWRTGLFVMRRRTNPISPSPARKRQSRLYYRTKRSLKARTILFLRSIWRQGGIIRYVASWRLSAVR